MPEGQGFTVGPAYRISNYDASFTTTAAISIRGAWEATGRLELPRPIPPGTGVGTGAARARFLSIGGLYHHLPQEDFYGFGQQSSRDTHVNFRLDESIFDVTGGVSPAAWFTVSGTAEYRSERAGRGNDPRLPSIEQLPIGVGAPGSQTDLDFVRLGGQTYFNYAEAEQRAPVGGRYLLSLNKYLDQTADQFSFNRWEVDLQQYVPIFTPVAAHRPAGQCGRRRSLTTAMTCRSTCSRRSAARIRFARIPHQRFRDRNSLLLQAEYRFILNDFMTGSLFYDTGKVAFDRKDLWDFDGHEGRLRDQRPLRVCRNRRLARRGCVRRRRGKCLRAEVQRCLLTGAPA